MVYSKNKQAHRAEKRVLKLFPKYKEIQIPLLQELFNRGGQAKPSEISSDEINLYDSLAIYFELSPEDIQEKIYESNGKARSKWKNMVRWARNDLLKKGLLENEVRGVWQLSEAGLSYLNEFEKENSSSPNTSLTKSTSLDEFEVSQKRAKEIGFKGELFVIDSEKSFLASIGKPHLAEKVEHISLQNISAGYDVLSFYPDGSSKYIEVKTTVTDSNTFIITKNELEKAEFYSDKYWLYRVTKIDSITPKIEKIQNLHELISTEKFIQIPLAYKMIPTE